MPQNDANSWECLLKSIYSPGGNETHFGDQTQMYYKLWMSLRFESYSPWHLHTCLILSIFPLLSILSFICSFVRLLNSYEHPSGLQWSLIYKIFTCCYLCALLNHLSLFACSQSFQTIQFWCLKINGFDSWCVAVERFLLQSL